MIEPTLHIEIFDGECIADPRALPTLVDLTGSVTPYGRPPYSAMEEALRVLEMCAERYSTARPSGRCFTVLISRSAGQEVTPLLRLDVLARNGLASAGVVGEPPNWETEPVTYSLDDDAVEIVRKLLAAQFPQ